MRSLEWLSAGQKAAGLLGFSPFRRFETRPVTPGGFSLNPPDGLGGEGFIPAFYTGFFVLSQKNRTFIQNFIKKI